jgi:signal recognition particle receptor subunit beta
VAFANKLTREVVIKIAYHGPGLGGKTTNLRVIADQLPPDRRGEILTLDTATERTLFFDFLPVMLGSAAGWSTRLHLYTVPGQVYYGASRKLILKGLDVLVFVVDSQESRLTDNEQSQLLLSNDLREIGLDPDDVPLVVQFNKRDLPDRLPMEVLQRRFNPHDAPSHEAIARHGIGVMETLRNAAELAVRRLASGSGIGVEA